ncbi:signal transduction histidine hinase (plasmid) [Calothrix sp. NIES-4101]|nr:signal transduction histidine hinase [Calothrix sp. NIES-4101]
MNSDPLSPESTSSMVTSEVILDIDLAQSPKIDAPFPIVGIAASAGGLEAFTELIRHLPTDTGMAFVLIQHLSPDHESLLSEILGRVTAMPVRQVQEGMMVEPNEVYVIPPNTQMTLKDGMLHLAPRQKIHGKYLPADAFFVSLAADRGNKALAVVLSGTDGDGSQGIKAIKVAGGVTFAQCEETAKFDSMPNTAVATGNVDFILPPQAIAEELTTLSQSVFSFYSQPFPVVEKLPEPGTALTTIFAQLRTITGVDFTYYKPATLNRRMQRRMLLYKLNNLEDYAEYLQVHPAEVQALYEEILIHVTSFFRDTEAFEHLKEQVFPTISQNKSLDAPIRIWVAGCSTGEEVYSIAICLLEFFATTATIPPIQIFATDISEAAISKARSGLYLESQMEAVSSERRNRFFVPLADGTYQISSAVRELCVFAKHNLGGDPPFSNLDLISCRNVLIYLSDTLQERIMSLFHYSLNLNGFLILGTSESVKTSSDLFTSVNEQFKIYARKLSLNRPLFSFATNSNLVVNVDSRKNFTAKITNNFDLGREVDQLISNRYAPVSVVVNDQMDIIQMRGDTDTYLKLPLGTTDLNLLMMARSGLETALRTVIYQAQTQNISVRQEQIQVSSPEGSILLNLEAIPFRPAIVDALYFLVLFETVLPLNTDISLANSENLNPASLEREIIQLRTSLAAATQRELSAQAHLQAVIQEQNYLNQSLRVANEEILSSNEELQSTNEELQTAKEEIQATNEELSTTNDELRSRNLQQNRDNSDLNNFLSSISIPIVMLTNDLKIRRFTPTAQRLFNFIPTDIGRPFSDLRVNFDVPNLESMILEVLETLNTQEQEVQTQAGYWYSLRIRPYRTTENQIDGVTMLFVDIDALKRNASTLESARNYAEAIIDTVQTPLVVLDTNMRVNTANRSFYEIFQVCALETVQSSLFELGNGQWNIPQLLTILEEVLSNNTQVRNFEVEHCFEQIGQKTMLLNACRLEREDDVSQILLLIEDITERRQLEIERTLLLTQEQSARQQAETANKAKDEFLSNLSHELRNPLNMTLGWSQLLRNRTLDQATIFRGLEQIEQSAKAQAQLIEDILDVSRITSGKLNLNVRTHDLHLIVQAALDIVQLSASAKNIQIVSSLSSVTIDGDADRLQQVLWNLLSNAIKFTPPGGRVEITLNSYEHSAQIQVSDTGQGIEADLLPYIFERFRQGDSSTTKVVAGLGLGLSIVRHLVELHGGTVQAESPGEGQGATLTVWLPLPVVPSEESTPESDLEPSSNTEQYTALLAGLRILAVDNEVDTLELLRFMLENYGAEVLTATSASEALAALTANPNQYNLLLSDIGMPCEDGYFLIQQVRSLDASIGGQIPAIALTAYASAQDQQKVIEAGFQAHIAKPVEPLQLALLIANLGNSRK